MVLEHSCVERYSCECLFIVLSFGVLENRLLH